MNVALTSRSEAGVPLSQQPLPLLAFQSLAEKEDVFFPVLPIKPRDFFKLVAGEEIPA